MSGVRLFGSVREPVACRRHAAAAGHELGDRKHFNIGSLRRNRANGIMTAFSSAR